MQSYLNSKTRARGFRRDERGNVGIIFGAIILPLTFFTGACVDYGKVLNAKTKIQTAADAAALAGANAVNKTETERAQIAADVFAANIEGNGLAANTHVTISVSQVPGGTAGNFNLGSDYGSTSTNLALSNGGVTVTPVITVSTPFLGLGGMPTIDVTATSTVASAGKKLELAMMLDNTGSMDWTIGGARKMDSLKVAAKDLLDIVMPLGATNGVARVSLVPFSAFVNAGTYAQQVTGLAGTGTKYQYVHPQWGSPYWAPNGTGPLNTCVTERQGTNAYTDVVATGSASDKIGHGMDSHLQFTGDGKCMIGNMELPAVKPLSSDKATLITSIDAMDTGGATAGHLGTAWSWYTIAPTWSGIWPVESAPAAYTDDKVIKAAVLMTDGQYNVDYTNNVDSVQQALALCQAMRDKGILVFTVGFGVNSNSADDILARDTLTQCAGGTASRYFFPYDGPALQQAFQSIGQQLTNAQGKARVTN